MDKILKDYEGARNTMMDISTSLLLVERFLSSRIDNAESVYDFQVMQEQYGAIVSMAIELLEMKAEQATKNLEEYSREEVKQ
ncbi:hypothetical protein [Streptococcus sp. NLN64]|uniref:hypothetical protein n=1 Tax=Streptococcus sp. NLN64 TaxID=2822799 RepID=UPI0018C9C94A|nr:hypothetical protein [Streptococcus sp. NLN64]MBG9368185.1 hypothetical protein [Streptococcus sp. NLN64]